MNKPSTCHYCGHPFIPNSPYPQAARNQKYCSRVCANRGNGICRRGRKWGQASREASRRAGVASNTVFVRLTAGYAHHKSRVRLIDGMDAFDDVKRAVKRAHDRMILQGRILPLKSFRPTPLSLDHNSNLPEPDAES
jgi:hypothetical protein